MKILIDGLEEWMKWEHTGEHCLDSFEFKDGYQKKGKDSLGFLGEAPKGLYVNPQNDEEFLFKWPKVKKDNFTHGLRETITELIMNKLVEQIAPTAPSSIGLLDKRPVFVTKNFVDNKNQTLYHGMEIFRDFFNNMNEMDKIGQNRKLQRKFYTLKMVHDVLLSRFSSTHILDNLHLMLLADAWVGNQDRHHENWGVLEEKNGIKNTISFAPIFDTSRGLFWNHTLLNLHLNFGEEKKEGQIAKYIRNSRPMISLDKKEDADHFDLASAIQSESPDIFKRFLDSLAKVDIPLTLSPFRGILHKMRIDLIIEILEKRRKTLESL